MFLSLFLKFLSRFSWYLIKIRHHVLCIVFISDCFWQLLIQQILSANNLPRKKDPTCTLICVSNIKLALSYISEICTTNNITDSYILQLVLLKQKCPQNILPNCLVLSSKSVRVRQYRLSAILFECFHCLVPIFSGLPKIGIGLWFCICRNSGLL